MYMAECKAINRTATSDDSMPTARAKPLSWQKAESDGMLPHVKLTIGNTTKMVDLRKSLFTSNKINLYSVSQGFTAGARSAVLVPEGPSHLHKPVQSGESRQDAEGADTERES
jgi:hypothetical protein